MDLEQIKKVSVFDFDGTLIDTTMPDVGKKMWKDATGEDYPHKGWWGRRESLDINIFPNKPFADIVSEFNKAKSEPNTFVVLCTGRITPLTNEVLAILNKYNFVFDDVVLTGDKRFQGDSNNTVGFKVNYLNSLQKQFPNLEQIEFWDDRRHHHTTFVQWGKLQPIPVKINLVH
jgi:hypothetical protein